MSRHLNRTRKSLRADVEAQLREAGLPTRAIDEAFAAAAGDPGDADLGVLLATEEPRKNPGVVRSRIEERS